MSDKGLLFKKRKNNHGSHNRCSQGSGFPRRDMDKFPGTHLGMKLRYQKASVGRLIKGWNINRGYLRTNRITGFIDKFIGKPYNDLVKAFYVLIKDLRNSHKEVGLADLEWHFEQFRYRRWRGDYYVDDDGLVQVVKPELDRKQTSHINKQQVAYNKKVKIPDFGRVSVPRKVDSSKTRCWNKYGFPDREFIHYEKCQYHAPRFLGNYWCDMDGKMLFLPVYHVPGTYEYAKYWIDTHGVPKPRAGRYYYGTYPKKWDNSGYCDRFTDKYRPGTDEYKWAQGIENGWVIPIIPFSKKEFYGLRYAMYMRMQHSKRVLLPNTEELERCKANIRTQQEALANTENPDSYWYGKTELVQGRLEEAKQRLERTPNMAYFEVGYGQLFPMVKRYDYEKALRIYEQEQKEADLERQE